MFFRFQKMFFNQEKEGIKPGLVPSYWLPVTTGEVENNCRICTKLSIIKKSDSESRLLNDQASFNGVSRK